MVVVGSIMLEHPGGYVSQTQSVDEESEVVLCDTIIGNTLRGTENFRCGMLGLPLRCVLRRCHGMQERMDELGEHRTRPFL